MVSSPGSDATGTMYANKPELQGTSRYYADSGGGQTVYVLADSTDASGAVTTYSYTWASGSVQMFSQTTTKPTVSVAHNGPGTADAETVVYDSYGRVEWQKDAGGFLTYTAYDSATGAVVKTITDVDTSRTSDFADLPSGWSTPSGGGLHLVTQCEVDSQGRTTKLTDPNGNITYTVYNDANQEVRTYPGWNSTTGMPTGPTTITRQDDVHGYGEALSIVTAPHVTSGRPDGTETFTTSDIRSLSRSYTNSAGQVIYSDEYFDLTGVTYSTDADLGTEGANFYRTRYGYDAEGRQTTVQQPSGTINKTVEDGQGRMVSTWVGTTNANLVEVSENVYDNGGVGDGNLTAVIQYPGAALPFCHALLVRLARSAGRQQERGECAP